MKLSGAETSSMAWMKAAEFLRGVKDKDKRLLVAFVRYSLTIGLSLLLKLKCDLLWRKKKHTISLNKEERKANPMQIRLGQMERILSFLHEDSAITIQRGRESQENKL